MPKKVYQLPLGEAKRLVNEMEELQIIAINTPMYGWVYYAQLCACVSMLEKATSDKKVEKKP